MLITLCGFSQDKPKPPTIGNEEKTTIQRLDAIKLKFDSLRTKIVIFKEIPTDTFALVPIEQIRNANEKFVYMYQLIEEKDTLTELLEHYKNLDLTKTIIIQSQAERIIQMYLEYNKCNQLNTSAEKIMNDQAKEIKRQKRISWGIAGVSLGLILTTFIFAFR